MPMRVFILIFLAIAIQGVATADINRLPRFQYGVTLSTMTGPGFSVQADISRLISLKGVIGGYYSDYEPSGDIDRRFFEDLNNYYLIPGFEAHISIDRSDKRKLYAFYAFSLWEFSEIEDFSLTIVNDRPIRQYRENLLTSRNHSIGLGYEMIWENGLALQMSLGYQYQYSTGEGYGWWADRSPNGTVNNGLGFGIAVSYAD